MTMEMQIRTNNRPRNLIYGFDLTDKERADFDYIDSDEIMSHDFVRYRGRIYDTSEFMRAPDDMKPWDGYHTDTYFSGICIRFIDDESVIMGIYYQH